MLCLARIWVLLEVILVLWGKDSSLPIWPCSSTMLEFELGDALAEGAAGRGRTLFILVRNHKSISIPR